MARPHSTSLALIAVLALLCGPALQAARTQDAQPPDPPARLKGSWQLNKELSTKIPEPPATTTSGRGGPGGRTGGRGNANNNEERNGPPERDPPELIQLRTAMREVQPPAQMLFIAASPTEVGFTTEDGTVRKFVTDGQRQRIEISAAKVDTKTTWSPAGLSQELVAGPIRLIRTWVVSERDQLVLTVKIEGTATRGTAAAPMLFVYDRLK